MTHPRITTLLIDLEIALQQAQRWTEEPPSPQAMASTEPFCIDTLDFDQWLQFVFLPRMRNVIDHRLHLPEKCEVAVMAETVWPNDRGFLPVIALLRALDECVNNRKSGC